jgi:molybdate transport system substrate-binding protein
MSTRADDTLKVLSTTAMKTVLEQLAPQLEQAGGCRLDLTFGPSGALSRRIAAGELADLVIGAEPDMADLTTQGRIAAVSGIVARSKIGVAVRKGAPKPDISTPEAFRRALLAAKSVAFSDPARGGASGVTLVKILDRLGIAAEVMAKAKLTVGGPAGLVGAILERGEAEIGVQQIPELVAFDGVDLVGPLPEDLQSPTAYVAGISANASRAEAAKAVMAFLATPAAAAIVTARGMEPG